MYKSLADAGPQVWHSLPSHLTWHQLRTIKMATENISVWERDLSALWLLG